MDMMQVNQGPWNSPYWNSVQNVRLGSSLRIDIGAVSTDQTKPAY